MTTWGTGGSGRDQSDGVVAPEAVTTESGNDPRPFVEGAWMTKFGGTYYLQYAAPGTELNTYGDGYYTSSSPLGPFTYSPDSPFSSVPGGFAPGAGHGSTVQDRFGNWWHVGTIRISVGHVFERRIGIYPAGFDADGVLFCNQEFADHPIVVPQRRVDPWTEVPTGWRLLSYQRPVGATSSLDGSSAEAVVDEDIRSAWVAGNAGPAEGVTVDIGDGCTIRAVQVNVADHDVTSLAPPQDELAPDEFARRSLSTIDHPVRYVVEVSNDGAAWERIGDEGRVDAPHRLVVLAAGTSARYVRVTGGPGAWGSAFALCGVRVFGERAGSPPSAADVSAVRLDDRTARVAWTGTIGADGVNVRYGRSARQALSLVARVRPRRPAPLHPLGGSRLLGGGRRVQRQRTQYWTGRADPATRIAGHLSRLPASTGSVMPVM